jgi:hypothetical protein
MQVFFWSDKVELIDAIETDGSVSLLTQQVRQRQTEIEQLEADRGIVEDS